VCMHARRMREHRCLAPSGPGGDRGRAGQPLFPPLDHQPIFRYTKDLRFGMGLSVTPIGEPARRDRLLLVSSFATTLLTLLGQVGESLGMDPLLESNTSKIRTHSLFRQGCMPYEIIPNMPEHRLISLLSRSLGPSQTKGNSADCLQPRNDGMTEPLSLHVEN